MGVCVARVFGYAVLVMGSWLQDYCYVAGGGAGHTQ